IVTGYVPPNDLPAYYSLIDIFVHPSQRDGMPNAVLEAMACEKAIIATPVGGIKDILENGKNGITVNVNDANMLAEKILELVSQTEKQKLLGQNARKTVVGKLTLEKELEANLEVYRKLGLKS
ncbi:MAG: glycosyltransferase family 4 protein, partial [Anaerolineales bacterium]|nr:glycosyltransferase family 4 protein [Anaerolineales bacterium]